MEPDFAAKYLTEFSADVRQVLVFSSGGTLLASSAEGPKLDSQSVQAFYELSKQYRLDSQRVLDGIEISDGQGHVFAVFGEDIWIVAFAGRSPLPALVLYDMRCVLSDLESSSPVGVSSP